MPARCRDPAYNSLGTTEKTLGSAEILLILEEQQASLWVLENFLPS